MSLPDYSLTYIIYAETLHFVSSAFVGLLAWWSTSTILHRCTEVLIFQRYSLRSALSLSFAVFIAILFHVVVDWNTNWF
jgi:hypothetical protein